MTNLGTLLPCPFCGGKADFEEVNSGGAIYFWTVGCQSSESDCIGYQMLASYNRKCEAAEGWNKRAAPSAQEPVAWRWRTLPKFSEGPEDQKWSVTWTTPNFINPHHHEVQALFALSGEQGREYEPGMNPVDDAEFGMKP